MSKKQTRFIDDQNLQLWVEAFVASQPQDIQTLFNSGRCSFTLSKQGTFSINIDKKIPEQTKKNLIKDAVKYITETEVEVSDYVH